MGGEPKHPGKINPDAGEPEKGAPDVGEAPPVGAPQDDDEPFPPEPGSPNDMRRRPGT